MSAIVLAGSNVDFSVTALDEGCAFTYTWRHFAQNLFGGTNSTFTLPNAQPFPSNKAGEYSVIVGDVRGWTTSSVARLTIVSGPLPSSISVPIGGSVTFSNLISGYGPIDFRWRFKGQDIPGATGATLSLSNVQPYQAGGYSVMIANPDGSVATRDAFVNVELPHPRLWGMMWETDGCRFRVTGAPNTDYFIEASEDFHFWRVVSTNSAPESGTFEVFDPTAAGTDLRYYRAVQP